MDRRRVLVFAFVLGSSPVMAAELVFEGAGKRMVAEVIDAAPMLIQARPTLKFRLDASSSDAFARFTEEMLGEELTISLCDQELVRAVVQSPIVSGEGLITVLDDQRASMMAEVLRGEADCASLDPPLGN